MNATPRQIKKIFDEIFKVKTPLKAIQILRSEVQDSKVITATVLDESVPVVIRLDLNADGTYAIKEYAW